MTPASGLFSKRQKTQSKKRAHLDKAFAARFGVTDGIHALVRFLSCSLTSSHLNWVHQPAHEARAGLSHRNNPAASEKAQIRSKPSPALDELASIRSHLDSISSSFSFPTHLVFDASSKDAPKLTYNAVNATLHSYEDALSKILSELDAVESNGDEEIRFARKEIARAIEATLSALDSKTEAAWQKLKGFPPSEQISDQIRDDLDKPAPGAERSIGHSVSPVVPDAHRRSPGMAPQNRTDEDKETEIPLNVSLEDAIRDLAPLDPSGIPTRLVSSRDRATSVADSDPNAAPQTPMPSIDNASHISEHVIPSTDRPSLTSALLKDSQSDDSSSQHIGPNSLNGVTSSEPLQASRPNTYLVPAVEEQSALLLPPPTIDTTSGLTSNPQYSDSENARSENPIFIEHLDRKNQSAADVTSDVDSVSSESSEDSIDVLGDHDVSDLESFEMVY